MLYCRTTISGLFLLAILFLWPCTRAGAQEVSAFDKIVVDMERTHQIRVFYMPEWFSGEVFSIPAPGMHPAAVLEQMLSGKGYRILAFEGSIAIVPGEGTGQAAIIRDKEVITIGDPLQYGRHRFATINGKVMDGTSGELLPGAVVYAEPSGEGAATDQNGYFTMRLPVGEQRLRVSFVGYQESYWQVFVVSHGEAVFELFQHATALDAVTVTAKRAEENLTGMKMSMVYLDAKTLKELPGNFGEPDIIRSMGMLPGIQTTGEFGSGFHVRGGSADQNLVLVEGVPLFHASHLFGLVSVVNQDMVTGVQLYKGGIPSSYGERASSVLEIRKSGSIPDRLQFRGGVGILNSRLHMEAPLFSGKAGLSFGARTSYSNWFLHRMPDADLMNSDARFHDLSGVFTANLGKGGTLGLFVYSSADHFLQGGYNAHDYGNTLASVRWNLMIGNRLYSRLLYGISRYSNQFRHDRPGQPRESHLLSNAIDYRTWRWQIEYIPDKDMAIEGGGQGVFYGIDPGKIEPIHNESIYRPYQLGAEQARETAAFVSARLEISERLGMEAGLRVVRYNLLGPGVEHVYASGLPKSPQSITDTIDYHEGQSMFGHLAAEPRINLRYLIDGNQSVKFSYNRQHQYIQLVSNTSVMTPSDIWKLSNSHIHPLRSDHVSMGYFRNFLDHSIESSIELYYKKQSGLIEYRDGAKIILNPFLESDLVSATGENYGLELFVHKKTGRLAGWLSYTFSRALKQTHESFQSHQVNQNKVFPSSLDKPHNFLMNANYHISRRWRLNTTFTYSTGRPATYPEILYGFQGHEVIQYSERNKYRLPDYHRLDVSISYGENLRIHQRGKGSWTLSVVNVYGRKNPFSVFYEKSVPHEGNNFRRYSLYKLYIIGRPLPMISYSFSF